MAIDRPFEIKVLRTMKHLTQADLAKECGVARETISKWERCESFPDVIQLHTLADALSCGIDDIFFSVNVRNKRAEEE